MCIRDSWYSYYRSSSCVLLTHIYIMSVSVGQSVRDSTYRRVDYRAIEMWVWVQSQFLRSIQWQLLRHDSRERTQSYVTQLTLVLRLLYNSSQYWRTITYIIILHVTVSGPTSWLYMARASECVCVCLSATVCYWFNIIIVIIICFPATKFCCRAELI